MKAIILAAGYGKRMRPMTDALPKALIAVGGKTLLQITIEKLQKAGINEIVVNVHYLKEQIIRYLENNKFFGMHIGISEETTLLDSGGGIKKAGFFLEDSDPFLVHNVDIVSDISLPTLVEIHQKQAGLATLAVSRRKSDRYLLYNPEGYLCGWENCKTGERIMSRPEKQYDRFAFSGIHCCSAGILDQMQAGEDIFSIIKFYLKMASTLNIGKYEFDSANWFDVGKFDEFKAIEQQIMACGLNK